MLDWEGCFNVRDLGGLPTVDGGAMRSGVLVRADSLSRLTEVGCRAARGHSVSTVIDLRSADEVDDRSHLIRRLAAGPALDLAGDHPFGAGGAFGDGVLYRWLTLWDANDDQFRARLASAGSQMEIYRILLDVGLRPFAEVARTIATAAPGAVVVHCHIGKDRTGLSVALVLSAVGVTDQAIAADYALSAACLAPLRAYRRTLDPPPNSEPHDRSYSAPPESLLALLGELRDAHGGAAGYLRAGGLTEPELAALRSRLVE
jgi:protein-tyrosine phosphatase